MLCSLFYITMYRVLCENSDEFYMELYMEIYRKI